MFSVLGATILGGMAIGTTFRAAAIIALSAAVVVLGLAAGLASEQPLRHTGGYILGTLCGLQLSYFAGAALATLYRDVCSRLLGAERS